MPILTAYVEGLGFYRIVSSKKKSDLPFQFFKVIAQNGEVLCVFKLNFLEFDGVTCGLLSIESESSKFIKDSEGVTAKSQVLKKKMLVDIVDQLSSVAFENLKCEKVQVTHIRDDLYVTALKHCGYQETADGTFFVTRVDHGLRSLSKMIHTEKARLLSSDTDLTRNLMERVGPIWYQYVSKGINLSEGGVPRSFITLRDLSQNINLQDFAMYRSDRGSVHLSDDKIIDFLLEESAISHSTNRSSLQVIFCYGAHEGIVRVARCIYDETRNNGVFWAQGSYGLLAAAFQGTAPVGYRVHLVRSDLQRGEKLSLEHLEDSFRMNPQAKTLFLELKTVAGAVYTSEELTDIVVLCKKHNIFLLIDAAHINLHFYDDAAFPDVISICQVFDYHEYAYVYTGSKTYGFERGRVGFIVVSQSIKNTSALTIMIDLYRNIGAGFDLPYELASALLNSPLERRIAYVSTCREDLKFNMNLMVAYVEGIASDKIDQELLKAIQEEIHPKFWKGIKGIKILYKPKAGVQLKIDMQGISGLFFHNVQMFNSEIFCYAFNKVMGVVTLHSYCFLSFYPYLLRLSFSFKDQVHDAMRRMHDFVGILTDAPKINRNMPNVPDVREYLEASQKSSGMYSSPEYNRMLLFKHASNDGPEHIQLSSKL